MEYGKEKREKKRKKKGGKRGWGQWPFKEKMQKKKHLQCEFFFDPGYPLTMKESKKIQQVKNPEEEEEWRGQKNQNFSGMEAEQREGWCMCVC